MPRAVHTERSPLRVLMAMLALWAGTLGAAAATAIISAQPAGAVGDFPNRAIADYALAHYAVGDSGGQCRVFVNTVVKAATGINLAYGAPNNYFKAFEDNGALRITDATALKRGDIVQQGNTESYSGLHTFIIVDRIPNTTTTYNVIDSNHNSDEKVDRYNRVVTLDNDRRAYRLGTVATPQPAPAPPPPMPSPPPSNDYPVGDLVAYRVPGGVRLGGWALDGNTTDPIAVHVYGGTGFAQAGNPFISVTANLERQDIATAYPGYGPYHGYSVGFVLPYGQHHLCAYGINVGAGSNRLFDCVDINVSAQPQGNIDDIRRTPGGLKIVGWSLDPDTDAAIGVHVYGGTGALVAGNPAVAVTANANRPDVAIVWQEYSPNHGYEALLPAGAGSHRVCAYGLNAAGTSGSNQQLVCRDATVSNQPTGNLESVERVAGGVMLHGWALDPDTANAIDVHFYGGNGVATAGNPWAYGTANTVDRPDVEDAFPEYGSLRGYSVFMATSAATQTFCAYGINAGAGSNQQIGCLTG